MKLFLYFNNPQGLGRDDGAIGNIAVKATSCLLQCILQLFLDILINTYDQFNHKVRKGLNREYGEVLVYTTMAKKDCKK